MKTLSCLVALGLAGCNSSPIPVEPIRPASLACDFDRPADPGRPVLATAVDSRLMFVRGDGSATVAHTFGDPADAFRISEVVVKGELILARATTPGQAWREETILLKRDGSVVFAIRREPGRWSRAYLSEWGLALRVYQPDPKYPAYSREAEGVLVDASGVVTRLGELFPAAAPLSDGTTLVQRNAKTKEGWNTFSSWIWHAGAEPRALAFEPKTGPAVVGDRYVYAADVDGSAALIREDASGAAVVPVQSPAREGWQLLGTAEPRWALVGQWEGKTRYLSRIDLDAKRVNAASLPDGTTLKPMEPNDWPGLDADGSLLMALGGESAGGLHRSVDLGATWQRVGKSMSGMRVIEWSARGGAYLVHGTNERYAYNPLEQSTGGELVGESVQIASASGAVAVLPLEGDRDPLPAVNADGRCAAFFAGTERLRLRATNVGSARTFDLAIEVAPQEVNMSPVWLE